MKELIERWASPTPRFWKKIRGLMITVGAVSGALLSSPIVLPGNITSLAEYGLVIGIVGTALSQTASVKH